MKTNSYDSEDLRVLFREKKVVTFPELKKALGTRAGITVFRKLRELPYLTSYSHSGMYYTLSSIPRFNQDGLWCFEPARFSKQGTLKDTLAHWIPGAKAGYFERELEDLLRVVVRVPLSNLMKEGIIAREKLSGIYLYTSPDSVIQKRQIGARKKEEVFGKPAEPVVLHHELRAALLLFFSLLNEKQQRFYAGLESMRRGRGGDKMAAEILGVHPQTIAQGRKSLLKGDVEQDRIRKAGGGRPPVEKKARNHRQAPGDHGS